MKKTLLTIGLFLGLAAAPLVATDWCVAVADCGAIAEAPLPPGGSCNIMIGTYQARVIVFDSAGNVVGADFATCPIGPC